MHGLQWDYFLIPVTTRERDNKSPNFDDKSSFFPSEIEDAFQYINLGYEAQAPRILIL